METIKNPEALESEFDLDKIRALPKFDVAEYLDTPEVLAAYLSEAFADGDPALIAEALNAASRAVGMTEIAAKAGIGRESLYKALRPGSQPRLETILGVVKALGYQLVVQPIPAYAQEGANAE